MLKSWERRIITQWRSTQWNICEADRDPIILDYFKIKQRLINIADTAVVEITIHDRL